jgi:hypothetical protein
VLDPAHHRDATLPPEPPRSRRSTCVPASLLPRVSHGLVVRVLLRAEQIRRTLDAEAGKRGGPTQLSAGDTVWLAGDASEASVSLAMMPGQNRRDAAVDAAAWALLALTKIEAES